MLLPCLFLKLTFSECETKENQTFPTFFTCLFYVLVYFFQFANWQFFKKKQMVIVYFKYH